MSIAWLLSVAVVTQYPEGFLDRPEVKAFTGTPRAEQEVVARMPRGFVVGLVPEWDRAPAYFVLDANGHLDAATTKRLDACLPSPRTPAHPLLTALVGGRGVVIGPCLVDGTEVLPVADLWGTEWARLAVRTPLAISDEAIEPFRASREYQARLPAREPPPGQPVELPNSPYDLVQVWSNRVDRITGQPHTKLFVIGRGGGPIHAGLTRELARLLRGELSSQCSGAAVAVARSAGGLTVTREDPGEGEEGGRTCQVLVLWENGALAVTPDAFVPQEPPDVPSGHRRIAALQLAAGDVPGAIATWESIVNGLPDTPDRAVVCRDLARAYERVERENEARALLEQCAGLQSNRGETLLLLGDFLWRHREPVLALARLEEALEAPLGESDRRRAHQAVIRIELDLAEAAAQAGQRVAARLHYEHLLQTPLADAQAALVRRELRRLR